MARITVEDCLEVIPNRFDLTLAAAKRARSLANGKEALVDKEDDKVAVIALREIAEGHTDFSEPEPHEVAFDAFKSADESQPEAGDEVEASEEMSAIESAEAVSEEGSIEEESTDEDSAVDAEESKEAE